AIPCGVGDEEITLAARVTKRSGNRRDPIETVEPAHLGYVSAAGALRFNADAAISVLREWKGVQTVVGADVEEHAPGSRQEIPLIEHPHGSLRGPAPEARCIPCARDVR